LSLLSANLVAKFAFKWVNLYRYIVGPVIAIKPYLTTPSATPPPPTPLTLTTPPPTPTPVMEPKDPTGVATLLFYFVVLQLTYILNMLYRETGETAGAGDKTLASRAAAATHGGVGKGGGVGVVPSEIPGREAGAASEGKREQEQEQEVGRCTLDSP
jgi:hypothetical protein